ncbi:unnamed protein product, partial [Medioppia subpectinata]
SVPAKSGSEKQFRYVEEEESEELPPPHQRYHIPHSDKQVDEPPLDPIPPPRPDYPIPIPIPSFNDRPLVTVDSHKNPHGKDVGVGVNLGETFQMDLKRGSGNFGEKALNLGLNVLSGLVRVNIQRDGNRRHSGKRGPIVINSNELRKRFETKGEITDINVNPTKRHAIIGYKDKDSAEEAINYFHKTYIFTNKISVNLSDNTDKKFIKYDKTRDLIAEEEKQQKDIEKKQKKEKKKKILNDELEELRKDPEFDEFLKLQRNVDSGKGKHIWSNDLTIAENNVQSVDNDDQNDESEGPEEEEDDDNKNDGNDKKKSSKKFEKKSRQKRIYSKPCVLELTQVMVKHRGFMDGHRIEITRMDANKPKADANANTKANPKKEPKWKFAEPASEPVGESGRIYVRNLSYTCDETELRELFEQYGQLSEFNLPIDSYTKKQKGFAFVTYVFPEHAVKAVAELDKTDFRGRLLHLIAAKPKPEDFVPPFVAENEKSSYKKTKQAEKKSEAHSSHQWNSLFIGTNAVADIMAKKFNIKKSDLLADSTAKDSVAVRMALGETQIVNEMRRFLLENGVHLKAFGESSAGQRSKTVILVKNLPIDTKAEEIRALFERHGLVLRVILPPNGVTAIVEMQETNEAKQAFNKLAYNNFKHFPLYLEWAPDNVFRDPDNKNIDKEIDELIALEKTDAELTKQNITSDEKPDRNTYETNRNEELDVEPEEDTTLFVKNLYFETSDEDFGNHFRKCGQIYSANIAYKKSADKVLSMGYGFVQFVYQKSAQKALKELQNSVLDGHTLELKLSNRTTQLRQNASSGRRSANETQSKQTGTKICVKNIPFEATQDDVKKLFSVFGELKAVRLPKKLAQIGTYRGFGFVDFVTKTDAKVRSTDMKGLPFKVKKRQIKDFIEPLKPMSLRLPPKVKGIAYISFGTQKELTQVMVKHRGFMDGHRIEITRMDANKPKADANANTKVNPKKEPKWKFAEPASEPVGESGRIYVRNLSYTCDETELRELFEQYGQLSEFNLPIDSYTKKQKGFAFVTYVFPEHAVKAVAELDKTDFRGRLLHLIAAKPKPEDFVPPFVAENEKSSYKKTKQAEKKSDAHSSHQWNSLFIGTNAVADIMAKKFNIKKSDLLADSTAKDSVAVRMALGETQIVNEMRRFLLENGVHLKAFGESSAGQRSKTVILVKNLPIDTKAEEIRALFERHGLVLRVILPPNGVTAIVEMQETSEAKQAFNKLAYNNFKHFPLYLEWAPDNVFRDPDNKNIDKEIDELIALEKTDAELTKQNITSDEKPDRNPYETNTNEELDIEPEEDTTLFVKNLYFETSDEDFGNHFRKCGQIYSANIAYKKSADKVLSMGYGFVQFVYQKSAQKALKELQNSVLDGHTLELKLSNRTTQLRQNASSGRRSANETQSKQTGTKICVKNIPFEATQDDVKKLFSVFGELKAVRLPKKLAQIGTYRGFGFVDFVTKTDAKRAFDALCHSTHLYGRPLVLEWARDAGDDTSDTEARRVATGTAHKVDCTQNWKSCHQQMHGYGGTETTTTQELPKWYYIV